MPEDDDRRTRPQLPAAKVPDWSSNPTLKTFPAVKPGGLDAAQESERPGPSRGQLILALQVLCDQVERLGGDVSEARRLLGTQDGD